MLTIVIFLTVVGTMYQFMQAGQFSLWGPVVGFFLGLTLGYLEIFLFPARFSHFGFAKTVIVKSVVYMLCIGLIFALLGLVEGLIKGLALSDFFAYVGSFEFWLTNLFAFSVFLGIVFFIERMKLDAENTRKSAELQKAKELEAAYKALEEAHENLQHAQARLIQSEKMASLGQLTAGIAHEIKNPLNFVNNFASLSNEMVQEIQEEYEKNPDLKIADVWDIMEDIALNADNIARHGQRADSIVQTMMQHARGVHGEFEKIDLNKLVEEYINLAFHGRRASDPDLFVMFERELDDSVGEVSVIRQDFGRVMINLLGNALDAVAEKARESKEEYQPIIRVHTERVGDSILLQITDNGPGVPEDKADKIFEPFFTTKPSGAGTGLGLSLSYDIITLGHDGSLSLKNTPGGGATFEIILPADS